MGNDKLDLIRVLSKEYNLFKKESRSDIVKISTKKKELDILESLIDDQIIKIDYSLTDALLNNFETEQMGVSVLNSRPKRRVALSGSKTALINSSKWDVSLAKRLIRGFCNYDIFTADIIDTFMDGTLKNHEIIKEILNIHQKNPNMKIDSYFSYNGDFHDVLSIQSILKKAIENNYTEIVEPLVYSWVKDSLFYKDNKVWDYFSRYIEDISLFDHIGQIITEGNFNMWKYAIEQIKPDGQILYSLIKHK